jgi:hypothetical protein
MGNLHGGSVLFFFYSFKLVKIMAFRYYRQSYTAQRKKEVDKIASKPSVFVSQGMMTKILERLYEFSLFSGIIRASRFDPIITKITSCNRI